MKVMSCTVTTLGVLPLGTANDFARALGLRRVPLDAARRLVAATARAMDLIALGGNAFCTVGGLGIVGAANLGVDAGVFEAVHGSAPDIAGKNIANPTALLRSALLMLDHLGEQPAAARIEAALFAVIADPSRTTRDLGGTASTTEFAEAICQQLRYEHSPS